METNLGYLMIAFAVADIKYNYLGIPFLENDIQNNNIHDFFMKFKHSSNYPPTFFLPQSLKWIAFSFFLFIKKNKNKNNIY